MPKKINSEAKLRIRITKRRERIERMKQNELKISKAKEGLEKSAKVIVDAVSGRVKEGIPNTTIYDFIIGEINKIVDDFEINFEECREEKREDFRKYLKAQTDVIYQQVLKKTGRIHN